MPNALLRSLAKKWMVSDDISPADAIVVLGGALEVRPAAAAALYKQGIAPLILVTRSDADRGREAVRMRERLLASGVPATAIVDFRIKLHSTYGEARGMVELAKYAGIKHVIVPVEIFQTRRVQWIFRRELSRNGIRVAVRATIPPDYNICNWWQTKSGRINFRNELIKFAYYRLRY
jgi:uncharacterized SAM-binding protein YcdF (DUF218 family)